MTSKQKQKEDRTKLLQFFRRSVRHVVQQGAPARVFEGADSSCTYYTVMDGEELRCAIGGAVNKDIAKVLEANYGGDSIGVTATDFIFTPTRLDRKICRELGISCSKNNLLFLGRLQDCHDSAGSKPGYNFIKSFLELVQSFAKEYTIAFDKEKYLLEVTS